jgi:hypothetical protein
VENRPAFIKSLEDRRAQLYEEFMRRHAPPTSDFDFAEYGEIEDFGNPLEMLLFGQVHHKELGAIVAVAEEDEEVPAPPPQKEKSTTSSRRKRSPKPVRGDDGDDDEQQQHSSIPISVASDAAVSNDDDDSEDGVFRRAIRAGREYAKSTPKVGRIGKNAVSRLGVQYAQRIPEWTEELEQRLAAPGLISVLERSKGGKVSGEMMLAPLLVHHPELSGVSRIVQCTLDHPCTKCARTFEAWEEGRGTPGGHNTRCMWFTPEKNITNGQRQLRVDFCQIVAPFLRGEWTFDQLKQCVNQAQVARIQGYASVGNRFHPISKERTVQQVPVLSVDRKARMEIFKSMMKQAKNTRMKISNLIDRPVVVEQ